jgi:Ser/Thr protein kinase RdoA (MazF antagonist)
MSEGEGVAAHAAAAALAARRLVRRLGLDDADSHVLHSSNNTIVHHPACGLVAKVWTSSGASGALARELAVARHLTARGAEIAPPAQRVDPGPHHQDGLAVTLWEFLPHEPDPELDDDAVADSIGRLHGHLATWDGELPDYRERIERTGRLLGDHTAMRAVPRAGLALLRARFHKVAPQLLERAAPTAVLHGGPHSDNVLLTPSGLRWIDLETCCRGPIEADLAYLGEAGARRAGVDLELLALAQQMLRVSVATVCWSDPDRHPRLREAAEYHLAELTREAGAA